MMELRVAFLGCRSAGDCAVITFEEKGKPACIVIDGGEYLSSAEALSDYLESQGVKTINLLVGTHICQDHINGLRLFVQDQLKKKKIDGQYINIKEFWGPMPSEEFVMNISPTSDADAYKPRGMISWQEYVMQSVGQNDDLIKALQELGTTISHPALDNIPETPFENVKIELLGPDIQISANNIKSNAFALPSAMGFEGSVTTLEELENAINSGFEEMAKKAKRNANNQSIVFRLSAEVENNEAKKWTFLFTGDAEEEAWEIMVENEQIASCLKAHVLKIPHHGSKNGIIANGAEEVSPKYSVNLVGQSHGIPDKEILKLLQGKESKILCTQRNQDKSKKSACYYVSDIHCPAKDNPQNICFTVNLETGDCTITPNGRECLHTWI